MVDAQLGSLALQGVDAFGVEWVLERLTGWTGASGSTRKGTQKPRQSGSFSGVGFAVSRDIAARGHLIAPSNQAAEEAMDRLNSAVSLADTTLRITQGGRSRWQRFHKSDEVLDVWLNDHVVQWSFQMASDDWRKFGADVAGSTALPSTTGGLTLPTRVPFTINAVTVTGQVSLINPGNEPGPVILRIDGPCQGPVITHVSSGAQLVFSSSLVLGPGEYLLIDMERRTVLANGQASRSGYITSRGWSQFDPGVNTYSFTAAVYDAASLLTVSGTPAWS